MSIQRQVVSVPGKDLTKAQSKDWYYDFAMTVGPGAQRIAFAVRDGNTGTTSFYQKNMPLCPSNPSWRKLTWLRSRRLSVIKR